MKPTIVPHRKLHICLVSNSAWSVYMYRQGLLRTLAATGVRVTVIAPHDDTVAAIESLGAAHVDIPLSSKSINPLHDLRTRAGGYRRRNFVNSRSSDRVQHTVGGRLERMPATLGW